MTGIEFVILKHDVLELEGSSLFVIQKQRRSSPDDGNKIITSLSIIN
jgi:hypothetical protein